MNVEIKQIDGISFVGRADSNHWVVVDGTEKFGGKEAASSPMELMLIALGSCTASDVTSILKKKRANVEKMILNISSDRTEEHPKVFTKIHIEFVFYGDDLKEKDLERSIELSQNKYCPISNMIKDKVDITYSYKLE